MPRNGAGPALSASEATFRALAETANDAILSANLEGNVTYWNKGAERMFGYTAAEAVGKPLVLIMGPACQQGIERYIRYLKAGQTDAMGNTIELAGRRKDAAEFPLELSLARGGDDDCILFTAIIRDITKRKRAEEARRLLLDGVKDRAIYMLDPAGRVASWNQEAERIKGYEAEEIIGQDLSRFYTPEDVERGKPQHGLKVAAAQGRFEEEGWLVRKDGSRFWAGVVITPLKDEAGQLRGFVETVRDYTG
jgi:PAS domain S-box-containing protein